MYRLLLLCTSPDRRRLWQMLLLLLLLSITWLALSPAPPPAASVGWDKANHLLAFAALDLWPRALATASDIDPVCVGVVEDNAAANGIAMGPRGGQVVMTVADGMDHPLLAARGPYDLIMANILAGPLVHLAPDFAGSLVPSGHLLLAGLLETQEAAVRAACRKAGLRLAARLVNGDWSILWLRRRFVR